MPTATLYPVKDLALTALNPTTNYNGIGLRSGNGGAGEIWRFLMHFDLTALPAYAALTSATLEIDCQGAGLLDVEARLHRLTQPAWDEGVLGVSGADWNTYDGANAWTAAGGDYAEHPNVLWYQPSSPQVVQITGVNMLALVNDAINQRSSQLHLLAKQRVEGAVLGTYAYTDREYRDLLGGDHPRLLVGYTAAAQQLPISEPTTTPGAARPAAEAAAERPARPEKPA